MIELYLLSYAYQQRPALEQVSLRIGEGEFWGILGPNGSGKSTLLKLLARALKAQTGSILVAGRSIHSYGHREYARLVGYLPQEYSLVFDFTVQELVLMGRYPHQSLLGSSSFRDLKRVRPMMETTDVWELRARRFSQLSGGERQRVLLAAALAQEPRVLLLDEPTRALDLKHQLQILEMVHAQHRGRAMTVILVTHDLSLAGWYCTHLAVLKEGRLVEAGPTEAVYRPDLLETVFDVPLKPSAVPRQEAGQLVVDVQRYRLQRRGRQQGEAPA